MLRLSFREYKHFDRWRYNNISQNCTQTYTTQQGDLSKLYNNWSSTLLRVSYYGLYCISLSPPLSQHVAHVEAVIDFGDEENIEPDVLEEGA